MDHHGTFKFVAHGQMELKMAIIEHGIAFHEACHGGIACRTVYRGHQIWRPPSLHVLNYMNIICTEATYGYGHHVYT